ncbi:hypothetical protein V8C34DRAFT_299602 [Trichoderma compactum]
MRFLLEISMNIRARTSPSFIVGVKLNSVEFQEGGFGAAEAAELCRVLQDEVGMYFVELSGGTLEKVGHEWTKETTINREAFFLRFAELIVPHLGKTAAERRTKVFFYGRAADTRRDGTSAQHGRCSRYCPPGRSRALDRKRFAQWESVECVKPAHLGWCPDAASGSWFSAV